MHAVAFFYPDLYVLHYDFYSRLVSLDCAGYTEVLSHDNRNCQPLNPPSFPPIRGKS